jgi:hypothetical protein
MRSLVFALVLFFVGCAASVAAPPDIGGALSCAAPPTATAEVEDPAMASAYLTNLLKLRQHWDLYPWIQLLNGTPIAQGAAPGAQSSFSMNKSYPIVFDKMPFWAGAFRLAGGNWLVDDLSSGAGTFIWSLGSGVNKVDQSQLATVTDNVLGSFYDEWITHGAGVDLAALTPLSGIFTLTATGVATANSTPALAVALRGYRLWAKGSISPAQLTRSELLQRGHKLEPYNYVASLAVDMSNAATTQSVQLTFDRSFLLHAIRVQPRSVPAFGSPGTALRVAIEPTSHRPITSEAVPYQMIMGAKLRSQWKLEFPTTIAPNEIWNIKATPSKPDVPGVVQVMDFVFDGELIR